MAPSTDDIWQVHDLVVRCLMTPNGCPIEQATAPGSSARTDLEHLVEQRTSSGLVATATQLPPHRTVLRRWSGGDSWYVELCWVDDLVLHDLALSERRPIVVDDGVLTLAEAWTMERGLDGWQLTSRQVTQMSPGEATWCR